MQFNYPYEDLKTNLPADDKIILIDHLGGFDRDLNNPVLDFLAQKKCTNQIETQFVIDPRLKNRYAHIDIKFSIDLQDSINFRHFVDYNVHPELGFKKFICCFNGSDHVSRKMLVTIVHQFGWFDPETCSKNFQFTVDKLDGNLADYLDHATHRFYRPFFIGGGAQFFDRIYSFGHVRYDHARNIHNLEHKLTQSFLHIVSETLATSYYPFVTEKFLYSVVTRGLFLAYAQPGWHEHVERYYGFRRYTKLFDYRFDSIQNPVERLVELMSMISKFSVLSFDDWRDLYDMESDTIEHNYHHYFSKNYMKYFSNLGCVYYDGSL